MFFTQDDYKKIQQWLIKNSVKDTEFNEANIPFNGEETITIVQGNQNKKVFLKDLIAQVFNLGISDFVNITDKYDAPNISLEEAIRLIPSRARKEGQVITFLNKEDGWNIYQFKGVLNQWNILDQWKDLFETNIEDFIIDSILPDEEDLTKSLPDENGNSYLSLKDREYNPEDFSGLGRIILRKNIVEVEDPIYGKVKKNILYQDMFTQSNTIYEIRYDFDLNKQTITLPDNSTIEYVGGSITNGNIIDKAGGLSRVILRKNIIENTNILSQDMIDCPNTIYEIKYDYDLNGAEITIPEGCVLDFQGGNLKNGSIIANHTKIKGKCDVDIIGDIYNLENIELSTKNFKPKSSPFNVYSSFSMFGDSLKTKNMEDKRMFYKNTGMNKLWLCILLQYDDINNKVFVPTWYEDYHNLGGLAGTVNYLKKNCGCETVCVKLHKNYNFLDREKEPKAYEVFCYNMIDQMYDLGIKNIFISNEEYNRIIPGSIWITSFKNIIRYAHDKNIKVGFSMNGWTSAIRDIDYNLLKMIDYPWENYYPNLNWKDENASLIDLPMMINTVYTQLLDHKKKLLDRKPDANFGISECGTTFKTKALRYPSEWNSEVLGEDDTTGNIFDLFWKAILEGAEKAQVYEIANWFLDENSTDSIREESINYIFNKIW